MFETNTRNIWDRIWKLKEKCGKFENVLEKFKG